MTHRVALHDRFVGQIDQDRGRLTFRYDAGADPTHAISLRMPVRAEPYDDRHARPFFENLLPEAEFRRLVAGSLRISEGNTEGLLGAIGGECAGAISIWPMEEKPCDPPEYEPLADDHVQAFFADDDEHALVDATMRSRLSIAGAQEKLALYRASDRWYLPIQGSPSTHILKRARRMRANLIENEFFSMRLAAVAGLRCATADIAAFGGTRVFVTKRYDRVDRDGGIARLHQEDFCQALGVLPGGKYQAEGGPSYSDCARLVQQNSSAPIRDLPALARWMIVNYLIGNADAHAKNVSFLYAADGVSLAPFYDIVSTEQYRELSTKAAMKFGNEYRFSWVKLDDWAAFIGETLLPHRAVLAIAEETFQKLRDGMDVERERAVERYGENPVFGAIADGVRRRIALAEQRLLELRQSGMLSTGKRGTAGRPSPASRSE